MSVYIDINETLKRIQTDYNNSDMNEDWGKGVNFAISRILRQPIADVVEVVRGEWIKPTDVMGFGRCSNCNALWDYSLIDNPFFNYCPNCGARMVEE